MKKLQEVAAKLGLSNRALLNLLHQCGYKVTSSSTLLSDEQIAKCEALWEKSKEKVKNEDKEKKKIRTSVHKAAHEIKKEKKAKEVFFTEQKVKETVTKIVMGKRTKKYFSKPEDAETETVKEKKIELPTLTSVTELASLLRVEPTDMLKKCLDIGIMATLNKKLEFETATLVAAEYGFETALKSSYVEAETKEEKEDLPDPKPPVVTVMGHVDHGKTTLLDYIRHTSVASKEVGGITQSIGAYRVQVPSKDGERTITFIDTPGHKAFTAMRARGARITDIVVIVIAADEEVMPQTVEAINHAKDAGVPIIIVINKIDIPNIIPGKIETQLMEHNIVTEKYGGETLCCYLSAKTGEGVQAFLEVILMQAEFLELRTSRRANPSGLIIESKMDRSGPLATAIISKGILKIGQPFIAGETSGKVRALFNEWGERIFFAEPSQPVQISGFDELAEVGDTFYVVDDERKARELSKERKAAGRVMGKEKIALTLESLQKELSAGEIKELKLIIKGDTSGATEALADSLEHMNVSDYGEAASQQVSSSGEGSKVVVIHKGIGIINESDVLLAAASNAIIIGYNVSVDSKAAQLIKEKKVEVRSYQIIYEIIDEIEKALKGLLPPKFEEQILGKAEIKQVFKLSSVGFIAGCIVLQGKIVRGKSVRLVREGKVLSESKIATLKRFKDQVKEVEAGLECGIGLEENIKPAVGDLLEVFEIKQVSGAPVSSG